MDNKKIYINDLSVEANQELESLINNEENAFDLLYKNHNGEQELTTQAIVARMQMQYFAKNPVERELKSNDNNGWEQNEDYEPNEVNLGIASVVKVNGKKQYSSFALKEIEGVYSLRYPLEDTFTSVGPTFSEDSMPDYEYNRLIKKLESKLKVKVREDNVYTYSTYKVNFFKNAIVKIKNAYFKLAKKYDKIQVGYAGCIKLHNEHNGYPISNVEKVVKIYDSIFGATMKKQAYLLKKKNDIKVTKDISFASRIYANLLMSRVTNFGNPEINKKVERCLALQFANILNRNNFSSEELRTITDLATKTAADACKNLGITTQEIVSRMTINGYDYTLVPTDEYQALLCYRERDYSQYKQGMEEKPKEKVEKVKKVATPTLEELVKEAEKLLKEPTGFDFIRNGHAREKTPFEGKITKEQIERIVKPENETGTKVTTRKPLKGIKTNKKETNTEEVVEEISTDVVPVTGYQPGDPLYISFESIMKHAQKPKQKKKFSDLRIIRGLKRKILRAKGIYKLKTGQISKYDFDEFVEESKGFGFIRNGVAHEKIKPELKISKEKVQYYLDVQSGYYLPSPEEIKALPAPKEVKMLEAPAEVKLLPQYREDLTITNIAPNAVIVSEGENSVEKPQGGASVNLVDSINVDGQNISKGNGQETKTSEEKSDVEEIVDTIINDPVVEAPAGTFIKGNITRNANGEFVASINQEQIAKYIDKLIDEQLKELSIKIGNAIVSKKYSKFNGKANCERMKELCTNIAKYYSSYAQDKRSSRIKTGSELGNVDSMAKVLCTLLIEERNQLVQDLLEGQQDNGPERRVSKTGRYENLDTVINRMFRKYRGLKISKKITTTTTVEPLIKADGTVKSYMKEFIAKMVKGFGEYAKTDKTTSK